MQIIKIPVPPGFEIESFDKLSGEVKLKAKAKPKDVFERIKSIDDVFADNDLTRGQFDIQCKELETDERAYRLLKLLTKSLNEGWVPDWNNENEAKYYPWFYMGGSRGFRSYVCGHWISGSGVGSRLAFKSSKLAEYAGTQFIEIYKQFMTIKI